MQEWRKMALLMEIRLQKNEKTGETFIWVLNENDAKKHVRLTLLSEEIEAIGSVYWGEKTPRLVSSNCIEVVIDDKQALVFEVICK